MMRLAFYEASAGTVVDWAIDQWTGKHGYSHCEVVFTNGECFSASPREGKVRFKHINLNDGKWEVIDLPDITPEMEYEIRFKALKLEGKKYDWKGIFLHEFLPLDIDSKNKWWCSEVCMYLLGEKDYQIDPNTAAKRFNVPKA